MVKLLKKLRQKSFTSIRTKLIGIFLLTSFLTSITAVLILLISNQLTVKMDDMFSDNIEIKEFLGTMEKGGFISHKVSCDRRLRQRAKLFHTKRKVDGTGEPDDGGNTRQL